MNIGEILDKFGSKLIVDLDLKSNQITKLRQHLEKLYIDILNNFVEVKVEYATGNTEIEILGEDYTKFKERIKESMLLEIGRSIYRDKLYKEKVKEKSGKRIITIKVFVVK